MGQKKAKGDSYLYKSQNDGGLLHLVCATFWEDHHLKT